MVLTLKKFEQQINCSMIASTDSTEQTILILSLTSTRILERSIFRLLI